MASRKSPSESTHREEEPRRRTRTPTGVILRLHTDLAANASHPLANIDPQTRSCERQRLIASILARLAGGTISETRPVDTMNESEDQSTSQSFEV